MVNIPAGMSKMIQNLICPDCGTSFEKDLCYRQCANCFACKGCEIYSCPGCASEIILKERSKTE